jgi:predicted RNase H-like nuclease (RuvC/YqgF family)
MGAGAIIASTLLAGASVGQSVRQKKKAKKEKKAQAAKAAAAKERLSKKRESLKRLGSSTRALRTPGGSVGEELMPAQIGSAGRLK